MHDSLSVARAELAPTGTLRVALNMSNFLLTATDPVTGEPGGIAADLGRELGQRLGVPVALLPYPNPGELADAATAGVWDVGLIGAEPQRADAIDFTAAYVEIEATYLVPPGSPLQTIADVDRPGVRIAAPARSAYELYLSRTLQHAQLIREPGGENAFKRFVEDRLDALAGLRPRLVTDQDALPGSRLLAGRFTAVQQAAGTPKGRPAGAQYLRAFIEDVKATGLVAQLIETHRVRGLTVAPPA
jgi:polar amino acid transport system substrate-binding protein